MFWKRINSYALRCRFCCVVDHVNMAAPSGSRRLTDAEQAKLLEDFYENIYEGERHFGDADCATQFEDEDTAGDNETRRDETSDDEEADGDPGGACEIDPNRDSEAESDDDEPL